MPDDFTLSEMMRVMGGLETSVATLNKNMDTFGSDLKILTSSCQSFEIYAKSRANLPERICAVEEIAHDYREFKPQVEKLSDKVDFLIKRYDAAMIIAAALNALAIAIAWCVQQGYIKVGL